MTSTDNAPQAMKRLKLSTILVPTMAILFFTIGYFEFFRVIGIGLESQIILSLIVGFIAPPILLTRGSMAIREPLFLLAITFLFVEIFVRDSTLIAVVGMAVAVLVVALVSSLDMVYSSKILKYIIIVAGIFSILAIIQFLVLFLRPALIEHTINPNYVPVVTDLREGQEYNRLHPIAYLGFTTGTEYLFGHRITRIHSFAREPGLLLLYFFLPGVLALTYKAKTRLFAIPLLVASILSFTGTVYASVCFAIMLFVLAPLAQVKWGRWLTWIPLILMIIGSVLIYRTTIFDELLTVVFKDYSDLSQSQQLGFLDKYQPAMTRLQKMREISERTAFGQIVTGRIPGAVGLIMHGFFRASFVGASLSLLFLYNMFEATSHWWIKRNKSLVCALLLGIYVEVGLFQQYGFTLPSGFLISALTIQRLRFLSRSQVASDYFQIESGRVPFFSYR